VTQHLEDSPNFAVLSFFQDDLDPGVIGVFLIDPGFRRLGDEFAHVNTLGDLGEALLRDAPHDFDVIGFRHLVTRMREAGEKFPIVR